jgi:DNA-binding NarL/FixJ family response regulator
MRMTDEPTTAPTAERPAAFVGQGEVMTELRRSCIESAPFSCEIHGASRDPAQPTPQPIHASTSKESPGDLVRKGAHERQRVLLVDHERQRVLVVDNVRLTRECLGQQLQECCRDLDILAVASSNPLSDLGVGGLPDIAVVNAHASAFSSPGLDEEIQHLRAHSVPSIAIVERVDQARTDEAARRGLAGIFPGDGSINLLVAAVRLVLAGGRFLPSVRDHVSTIEGFMASDAKLETPDDMDSKREIAGSAPCEGAEELENSGGFTNREGEILKHLRRGSPNKVIARDLGISESTVKAHLRHIMQKLGAANRTEVVSLLIEGKLKKIDAD